MYLFVEKISQIQNNELEQIKKVIEVIINEKKIKFKDFGQPLRLILTGTKFAPSINEIIACLGIVETKKRLSLYF